MPPHAAVLQESFHAAPNAAFPAGYIEILTHRKKNGRIEVTDVSFMGMNLEEEEEDDDHYHRSNRARNTNPLQLANELDMKQNDATGGMMYGTLTENFLSACGGAAGCVSDDTYVCGASQDAVLPALKPAIKKSSSNSIAKSPKKTKRRVNFKSLQIRHHSMTLGDHPSAASGPPIQLSWEKASEDKELDLDKYESGRQPRRSRRQLKMSFRDREQVLMQEGFTIDQVREAWEESLKVRQQRYETLMQGVFSTRFEEAYQSANRKFWRLFNYDTV
mmetsp:Transcript_32536/g.48249  ORF Transcript_32536/g.48249 Transcript_32536/m.48249 type:complete len:275 (-) Transcript_32536:166-990(-)|eukprot:CAMPEP_0194048896 /NCGR_PEP_ID=MMETSP0009_2-20130614/28932_1 /TAXON_ID=210454 /ORGANISM="Grammatophora oceanica, Strain CCMP 410" /LENGTH=274 /DNA_ID=CAMNT_0038694917 /DNA_START=179 /DNA_END=1003 /DNA_ORIENTATION=+